VSRQIRRLSFVFGLLLIALLANVTLIQVINARDYRDRPGNQRILLAEYDRERGPILVASDPVARSVETGNTLTYIREYNNGPLYAPVTGFYSLVYGATGLERTENRILNGKADIFSVDRIQQLVSGRQPVGGAVTTTIDAAAQRAAFKGLRGKRGAVVAIEPATGRILASVQMPSFDPNRLSSHNPTDIREYYAELEADPNKPLLNRPVVSLNPPGSTFKRGHRGGRTGIRSFLLLIRSCPGPRRINCPTRPRNCATGMVASVVPVARSPWRRPLPFPATPLSRGWVMSSGHRQFELRHKHLGLTPVSRFHCGRPHHSSLKTRTLPRPHCPPLVSSMSAQQRFKWPWLRPPLAIAVAP